MKTRMPSHRLLTLAGLTALGLACTDSNPTNGSNPDLDGGTGDLAMGQSVMATSVSPTSGPTSGSTLLTITGTNFRTGATVTVGGQACAQVTVVAATQITCMTPANLGKSGKVDVVVSQDGQTSTLGQSFAYFLSTITFAAQPRLQTPLGTRSLALGDWNGDRQPDLATVNETANNVTVRLGTSNGSFSTTGMDYALPNNAGVYMITSGEINGDANPDLVTVNQLTRNVSVLLGSANGMFQGQIASSGGGSVGMLPESVTIADFTGDGTADLVTADFNSNRLTLLVGDKTGAFNTGVQIGVVAGNGTIVTPSFVISQDSNEN